MSISDINSTAPLPKQPSTLSKLINACESNVYTGNSEKLSEQPNKTDNMPGETIRNNASVVVTSSNAIPLPATAEQSSDLDEHEDFDQTAKTFGAHNWIFNYKDVSFPYSWTNSVLLCRIYSMINATDGHSFTVGKLFPGCCTIAM